MDRWKAWDDTNQPGTGLHQNTGFTDVPLDPGLVGVDWKPEATGATLHWDVPRTWVGWSLQVAWHH